MDWPLIAKAAAMFAVTNIDDMLVLALFFGRAGDSRPAAARIVVGQYLGFTAIVAVSVLGALGANLLPEGSIPYLGLIPLLLGLRAAWSVWRERRSADQPGAAEPTPGVGILRVAGVTFANGGDNISVYVPVFALAGAASVTVFVIVFLAGVALWCCAGWFVASRKAVAELMLRFGDVIFPVVLIGVGLAILVEGGAFTR